MQTLYHGHGGGELIEKIFGLVRNNSPLTRIAVG
jgi:hypothetical protein